MIPKDKKRFAVIMATMAENFNDEISKPGLKMRFNMLKDFTIEQVALAAKRITGSTKLSHGGAGTPYLLKFRFANTAR